MMSRWGSLEVKKFKEASFLSFEATFLKEVLQKSFVFELQSFILEGSLAQKASFLNFKASFFVFKPIKYKTHGISHPFTVASLESNQFHINPLESNLTSLESQISCITWVAKHLNPKALESQSS